ncbi:MAG: AEC family transporter [Chloroflexi bacterium]|nr:MAG: AEC family transporter [Chloroflexota bacterium]
MILELIQIFIDNIAPILLIAGVGFAVGRGFKIDPKPISTVIFYVLSPSLVFYLLYSSDIDGGEILALYVTTIVFQLVMLSLAFIVLRFQHATPVERSNVMLSAFCLNAGNYGLSLVAFAFGEAVLSRAAVVFIANVTLNYSLGVFVASNGRSSPRESFMNVLKTPAVYGVVLAFALRALEIELPLPLARSSARLADAAIPMMLIMLGLQLGHFARFDRLNLVATGVGLRLLIAPFIAIALAALFMLEAEARTAFIIEASTPTAVLTIVFATEFDLDRDLALNLIMVSTLLSPLTLSVLIAWLQ